MRRGTTPTHTFEIPFDTSNIKTAMVIYAQEDAEVFRKETGECNFDGNKISVKLTQEETLKLKCAQTVQIQLRILTNDGEAMATDVRDVSVGKCLNSEVLK